MAKRESVCHLVSECNKLAHKKYKKRHVNDWQGLYIWKLCELYHLESKEKWYEHHVLPEGAVENDKVNQ